MHSKLERVFLRPANRSPPVVSAAGKFQRGAKLTQGAAEWRNIDEKVAGNTLMINRGSTFVRLLRSLSEITTL
jgi:hypothetical protein